MYVLISENLTGLGGPMGSETTWENWRKHFIKIDNAQEAAEKDYGGEIDWSKKPSHRDDLLCSGDLGHVMYHIREIKIEE